MWQSILAVLSVLASIWKKYCSPEAELARLKERQKAVKEMETQEAKRLKKEYKRIEQDKGGSDADELARLNRRRK